MGDLAGCPRLLPDRLPEPAARSHPLVFQLRDPRSGRPTRHRRFDNGLLEFFFQIHDPTTKNRQGNDVGPSYRSAIYYTSDEQRTVAEETIADIDASGLWPGKVVTEVAPAGPFWEAEPEHQNYLQRYPNGYTCHYVRPNWKLSRHQPTS